MTNERILIISARSTAIESYMNINANNFEVVCISHSVAFSPTTYVVGGGDYMACTKYIFSHALAVISVRDITRALCSVTHLHTHTLTHSQSLNNFSGYKAINLCFIRQRWRRRFETAKKSRPIWGAVENWVCVRCNVAREVVAGGVDHIGKYVPNPIPRNL